MNITLTRIKPGNIRDGYGISFVLAPATVLSLYGMTQGTSDALAE